MESIIFKANALMTMKTIEDIGLSDYAFTLIDNIKLIMELIIPNTLKFNKFTTIEEIAETEDKIHTDRRLIENICEALCKNNGLLIRLISGEKKGYKLNTKIYA